MQRCLELAKLGAGYVAPNPMVGAVLVHENRIIGEGWHQQYGGPHAEVNCIESVMQADKELISGSVLYISLEPCAHFGKTPPCTDLIIQYKIPKVVIGCRDPFKEVDGKGIEKLKAAGVEVTMGELENECKELNKRFFTFHTKHRPYVILKWAQTADGKISAGSSERLLISNEYSNRLVHQWRSEEAAILVGSNTALLDDPELTTRLWPGNSPVRLVVDMELKLPESLKIFNQQTPTIIFNTKVHTEQIERPPPAPFMGRVGVRYYQVTHDVSLVRQIFNALHQLQLQSVLVEGGAGLLQSFIAEEIWDEARVLVNRQLSIGNGLTAPILPAVIKTGEQKLLADKIEIYKPAF